MSTVSPGTKPVPVTVTVASAAPLVGEREMFGTVCASVAEVIHTEQSNAAAIAISLVI
jgi:hypothetical protein